MYLCASGCPLVSLWQLLIEGRRGGKSSSVVTVRQGWNTLRPSRYSIKQKGFAWTWAYIKLNCFPAKSDPRKPCPETLRTAAVSPQQLGWMFSCGAPLQQGKRRTWHNTKSDWNQKKPPLSPSILLGSCTLVPLQSYWPFRNFEVTCQKGKNKHPIYTIIRLIRNCIKCF